MEDKIVVTVPQVYGSANWEHIDAPVGWTKQLGRHMTGHSALTRQIMQFLTGSPVVDYGSITYDGTAPYSDARIAFIDTIQRTVPVNGQDYLSVTSATSYDAYTDYLFQNNAYRSHAVAGTYTLVYVASQTGFALAPPGGGLATDSGGSTLYLQYGGTGNFYVAGEYYMSISVGVNTTTPINYTGWADGSSITFDVIVPEYTEELNWSKFSTHWGLLTTTNGSDGSGNAGASHPLGPLANYGYLAYDTGRLGPHTSSDTLSDANFVTLNFYASSAGTMVAPVDNWQTHIGNASEEFWASSAPTNPIDSNLIRAAFTAGMSNSATQATANRAPDKFTIFRGPGYVRIMGETRDYANPGQTVNPELDSMYFFGMMAPYSEVDKYPSPVAYLGNVGFQNTPSATTTVRPWWRAGVGSTTTADSSIWVEYGSTGYWIATAPFILKPSFNLNTGAAGAPYAFQLQSDTGTIPNLSGTGNVTGTSAGASINNNEHTAITDFNPIRTDLTYSTWTGFAGPRLGAVNMIDLGGPQIRPLAFFDYTNDAYWYAHPGTLGIPGAVGTYSGLNILANGTAGLDDRIETYGVLPGVFHGTETTSITTGGTRTDVTPGTTFEYRGRQLRVIVGADSSANGTYSKISGSGSYNRGVILFDMNEV